MCNVFYRKEEALEKGQDQEANKPTSKLGSAKGYICMLIASALYVLSISTSQAVGDKASVFLANIIRFSFEVLLSIVCITIGSYSFTVAKSDIYRFVLAALFNYTYITLLYISATLLPVGNLNGIDVGLYIACSTCFDVVRKHVSKVFIIVAGVAILGLILLTQPWHFTESFPISPCEYIDNNYSIVANYSSSNNITITIKSVESNLNPLLLGYILIVCSGICTSVADNIAKSLYAKYSIFCVFLWTGLIQALVTAAILTGMAIVVPSSLSLPSGPACLKFSIFFFFCLTTAHILLNVAFLYIPVSKAAIISALSTIGLYVVQRTLLKMFNPGNANAIEVLGIVLILFASVASPLISYFWESSSK